MSATGLDVFDKTLQTTNIWLDEIMGDIGPDRKTAWRVLGVVLHRLRNRLPVGLAANLGAQLPILVRGLYYDQYQPAGQPSECDTMEQFSAEVGEWLRDNRPVDPQAAVKTVFAVLARHVSKGEIGNVVQALPEGLRQAWPQDTREQAKSQMDQSAGSQQSGHSPIIGRDERSTAGRGEALEPATPDAKQNMVGGAGGHGPAR